MRKTSRSSKCSASIAFSSRAEVRSWPNGFSMIRRVQPVDVRRLPSSATSVGMAAGGTAR